MELGMGRPLKQARLYIREKQGSQYIVILDKGKEIHTGCTPKDMPRAQQKLWEYLQRRDDPEYEQKDPRSILVSRVLEHYVNVYSPDHMDQSASYHQKALITYWQGKTLSSVNAVTCREYTEHRMRTGNAQGTARRQLETLQAAINKYDKDVHLLWKPHVVFPKKAPPKDRVLTRDEVALILRTAKAMGYKHLCRFILIGLYTGSRHNSILSLQWQKNASGGYVDTQRGLIYRRGFAERETHKRRPPAKLSGRLLGHLRRWEALDHSEGYIVSWRGSRIAKERRAWDNVMAACGFDDVTPHTLRHTCATWLLQQGATIWDASALLGTSVTMLEKTYGHHSPDYQGRLSRAFYRSPSSAELVSPV
jgi:integrase